MAAFFKMVLAFFMAITQFIVPTFATLFGGGEEAFFEQWSAQQEYTSDYAAVLEKTPGKDFVVLNLTDVQLHDMESFGEAGALAKANIEKLVADTKPDLVTLTGDNAWNSLSYLELIKVMESLDIPWAPVMGNHDGQGTPGEFWCAYQFANAKNCLFKFGPSEMGYGNYIINITENGKIVHTLFMMDTHSGVEEDGINGKADSGYDNLWPAQFDWYKWAVNGIAKLAGHTVESTCMFHIPLVEYDIAYKATYDVASNTYIDEYAQNSFGVNHEGVCCATANNGFFALCKELGSTKNIIVGHDHVNCSSILWDGIRLSYGLKCGSGCYWESGMNGGTTLSINSDGVGTVEHHFIDPASLDY